jgi:hypothetical protein
LLADVDGGDRGAVSAFLTFESKHVAHDDLRRASRANEKGLSRKKRPLRAIR